MNDTILKSMMATTIILFCSPLKSVLVLDSAPKPSNQKTESKTHIRFERIPESDLPHFIHFNNHTRGSLLPEDNGSGCAWGDYDNDGDDDLFLCNLNGPYLMADSERRRFPGSRLWRNEGDGHFTDVTESAGLSDSRMDMAAVFADFDNDGDADLIVTNLDGVRLFRNDKGRFQNVTTHYGLDIVKGYCLGAVWGDYDRDGRLDLYICRYVDFPIDKARNRPIVAGRPAPMTTPANYPPIDNYLFHQESDGKFRDVTNESGTAASQGRSMQAVWSDFNNDGWIDLYVTNDQSLDCFYRNKHDGTFDEIALPSGIFDPRGAMGIALMDMQNDDDQDLLLTHWVSEDPAFYINDLIEGDCFFEDRAIQYGLRKRDQALVGWGTKFEDFDNDGDRDLLIVYGSTIEDELTLDVLKNPKMLPQKSQIFEWRDKRLYSIGIAAGPYFNQAYVGRGAAISDFDQDGRRDIAINNHGSSPALLRNISDSNGHWLNVKLVGQHCSRDAANARVTVIQKSRRQMQEILLGSSYLSGHTKDLHFGLGRSDQPVDVQVLWPCGDVQKITEIKVDRTIKITEKKDRKP